MDIGAGVVGAGVAVAGVVDRREVAAESTGVDIESARADVDRGIAGHPGGIDAIEGVGTVLDGDEEILRLADAQQMPRLLLGQFIAAPAHDGAEIRLLQRATDPETIKGRTRSDPPHGIEITRCLAAQILVLRALDHGEQRLIRPMGSLRGEPLVFVDAALRPFVRAPQRLLLIATGIEQRGQLVEGEHDIRAEPVLDSHRHLRCEPVFRTVQMGAKGDAVVVDHRQALLALGDHLVALHPDRLHGQHLLEADPQRHDLETTAVGEGGTGPVHEPAQPAGLVHDVGPGL